MGYNTVLVVFNDSLHMGAGDPNLGERIQRASRMWSARTTHPEELQFFARSGNGSASYGAVVSQEHADYDQIVIVGQNRGRRLRDVSDLNWFALNEMADCLRRHGWTAKEPPRRKKTAPALNTDKGESA